MNTCHSIYLWTVVVEKTNFVELTYIFEENSECKFKGENFAAPPSPLQTLKLIIS